MLTDHEPGQPISKNPRQPTVDEVVRAKLVALRMVAAASRHDVANLLANVPPQVGDPALVLIAAAEMAASLIIRMSEDTAVVVDELRTEIYTEAAR